ncbi:helix-turn-helix domain-containing protein [Streptococcus hyovaginalis]|uniref:helix-turn-helix domain-containing protein n=1 Tax=Streptococcus hyovaginalis TaxID=149015 RepID=UPI003BF890FA
MWNRLNSIATEKEMTIRQLSEISGVPYTTIRDTKFRDIGFSKAEKLADALGVSLDDLRERTTHD